LEFKFKGEKKASAKVEQLKVEKVLEIKQQLSGQSI
jgi:hypothetical protein